ncbi:MAG: HYR domain-containing protein [Bacteroidia bacterium]
MKKHITIISRFLPVSLFLLFMTLALSSQASHMMGVDLSYQCVSGNTYKIILRFYRDCSGIGAPGSVNINIRSATCGYNLNVNAPQVGPAVNVSAVCQQQLGNTTCNGGGLPGVQQFTYIANYTLPAACTDWKFSWSDCCRNGTINTINGPGGAAMYVEAMLNNVAAPCNNSPTFTALPVPYMCVNQLMNYNHGAFEPDGDSLTYQMIAPQTSAAANVNFLAAYNANYPIATTPANNFAFSTVTGQMTFTPALVQRGVCAVRVYEYRNGIMVGYVSRDIQMVVINCGANANVTINSLQNLSGGLVVGANSLQVCAGSTVSFTTTASDPNQATVIGMSSNNGVAIPGSTFTVSAGNNPKVGTFTWTTNANSVGFYAFTITVTDNNCPIPSTQVVGFTINVFGADLVASDMTICPGQQQTIQLGASVGGSVIACPYPSCYSWFPATGLSNPAIEDPTASVNNPTTYTVYYNDGLCNLSDVANITAVGSVSISPASPTICLGNSVQLVSSNTFPSSNNSCGPLNTPCSGGSIIKYIGSGNSLVNSQNMGVTPYNGNRHDGRMQMLVTAAELLGVGTVPGLLRNIGLRVGAKYSTNSYQGFNIKIGCTNLTSLATFQTGLTTVYNGVVIPFSGWNTYNFSTPYEWDGTSNIIVEICFDNTLASKSDPVYYETTPFTSVIYNALNNTSGCTINTVLTSADRPLLRFLNCATAPPIIFAWTSIAGDPVSTLDNTTTAAPTASPTQNTTYVVAASNGSCTVYDTVTVAVDLPTTLNDIPDTTLCPNSTITLTAIGTNINTNNVNWSTGQTGTSITVTPAATTTYTYSYTTVNCGTPTQSTTVTIEDLQPPVINNCPANITVNNDVGSCNAVVNWVAPTVTDNCSANIVQTNGLGSGLPFPVGTSTIVYTATDAGGNVETCTFTITVNDTQNPSIICSPNVAVNTDAGLCTASNVLLGSPFAGDNCSIASVTNNAPATYPTGTTNVTWTATDASGNTDTCVQTVTVTDVELPTITCPANVSANSDAGQCYATNVNLGTPVTSDNCGVASVTNNAPTQFPVGNTNVTWTVTDVNGNINTCVQVISVSDVENPTITCPVTVLINTNLGVCTASNVNLGTPVTGDNCGVATVTNNAPATYNLGTTTITWTVTDIHGNSNTCTQDIVVTDVELPTIICPANLVVTADVGVCTASNVNLGNPITNDNCSVASVTNNAPATGVYPIGTNSVTWTVTDGSGNTATCTQLVVVTDTENPTITCPADVTVNADAGLCSAANVNLGTPGTSDNCGITSVTNNAINPFPVGTTVVTWTVTDLSGNTATCTQNVTVNDVENPTITCPTTVLVNTDLGVCTASNVNLGAPVTADNCAVATVTNNAPTTYNLGTTTITWTVTDIHGNSNTCNQDIVVTDAELPTITCPANVAVNTDVGVCLASSVTLGNPVTNDNCSVASVTNDAPATYPTGTTNVTWTVTDGSGNTATCIQTVTVTDIENPTITCPANVSVNADAGQCYATNVNLGTPVTGDNCAVASVTNNAPAQFAVGNTNVTWTVTDASGNTNTCVQVVTVTDVENPTITCPATVNVGTDVGICTASGVALGNPTTADNCAVASVTNNAPATYNLGNTVVTWTVTDIHGNSNTCTQTVTVTDNEAPSIVCPANVNQNVGANCDAVVNYPAAVANDNCQMGTITYSMPSGSVFPIGNTLVTCTATDAAGNSTSCQFNVNLIDNTPPIIVNCPPNQVINLTDRCSIPVTWIPPTVNDNCPNVVMMSNILPGTIFGLGTTTVTYTAVDAAGNLVSCSFDITINPPSQMVVNPPVVTQPNCFGQKGTASISVTGGSGTYSYSWTTTPAQLTATATNLSPGSYVVYITDVLAGACVNQKTAGITIVEPTLLELSLAKTNVLCNGLATGALNSTVTGGTTPYAYAWSAGPTPNLPNQNNLPAGTYTLTVTDSKGCTITKTAVITQPSALAITNTPTNVKCFGASTGSVIVHVTGGATPYTYAWTGTSSISSSATNLAAGTYSVIVTDANGCTISTSATLTQPNTPLVLSTTSTEAICFNDKNGTASVVAQGGIPPYTYTWNSQPNQYTTTANNLKAGNYMVLVKDSNGCVKTQSVSVGQPTRLDVKITDKDEAYCDLANGNITANALGGTPPYNYAWEVQPPQNTAIAVGLFGDSTYQVFVTDAHNCKDSVTTTINNVPPATAAFLADPSNLDSILLTHATILFTNQSAGAVSYSWDFGDGNSATNTNPRYTYTETGEYTVTLTAYNKYGSCPTTYQMAFIIIPAGNIFIPNAFSPNDDGINDEVGVTGEGIITFNWQIFDRWGVKVYETSNPSDKWNGVIKGKTAPEGAYTYIMTATLNDGKQLKRSGTILILR